jgi:hypothetical protein
MFQSFQLFQSLHSRPGDVNLSLYKFAAVRFNDGILSEAKSPLAATGHQRKVRG